MRAVSWDLWRLTTAIFTIAACILSMVVLIIALAAAMGLVLTNS